MMKIKCKLIKKLTLVISAFILAICLAACASEDAADTAANTSEEKFDAAEYYAAIESCVSQIREKTDFEPDIALVLGSGLGDYAENIEVEAEIPYTEIDGFPQTTVSGHEGKLIFGTYAGKKLVVMKGRVHYYEGYSMYEVVLPLRIMHMLGADTVILTNAVGAINEDYAPGEFVAVSDHISSFVPSPLIGENVEELGERFTDMSHVYDEDLRSTILQIAEEQQIPVHSGILVQTTGPQYETPAEIRMYRSLGADIVGMSTVVEAIAAKHMGMRVCALSCVTNMAAGMQEELSHSEVSATADAAAENFTMLINMLIERISL